MMTTQDQNDIDLDLADPGLFGNDAGEDEDPEILASYFVEKPSFVQFSKSSTRFSIVRARKGQGKSALLSKVSYEIDISDKSSIVISVRGSDLTGLGEFSSTDPSVLINQWQQVLCARINIEIGKRLHLAMTDTTMTMVESSELSGFRGKNIVGALLERLKGKLPAISGLPEIQVQKLQQVNPLFLLQNYSPESRDVHVWIFIDDIDSTFINTPNLKLKIATFFSACRKLVNDVTGIYIRASVRTDVWTEIRRADESLDKCEQYIIDISWSHNEAKRILTKKIFSYIHRTYPKSEVAEQWDVNSHSSSILKLVFSESLRWGQSHYPAYRVVHLLSAGRPRWAGQLCRLAGQQTVRQQEVRQGAKRIGIQAIKLALPIFGRLRLDDLYREHSHQFVDLQNLIECFAGGHSRYSTKELRKRIADKYVVRGVKNSEVPTVYGYPVTDELELCRFLYKIGFIDGRYDQSDNHLSFVRFEERPELLTNEVNLDDGLEWEIHPSYRYALRIKLGKQRKG